MKGYMYILKCSDGSYYTGSTQDLEKRLCQHQNGEGAEYTKTRLPVELAYFEEYQRIDAAFCREKQIQGWTRKKKEALISGRFDMLKVFAKNHSASSAGSLTELKSPVGEPAEPTGRKVVSPLNAKDVLPPPDADETGGGEK